MKAAERGLQPERTALAWSRTALATFVNAMVVTRAGLKLDSPLLLAVAGLAALTALWMLVTSARRRRHLAAELVGGPPAGVMLATAGVVALLAFAALDAVIVSGAG